jgi:hypothetical protein
MTLRWDDTQSLHPDDKRAYEQWYDEHAPAEFKNAPGHSNELTPGYFITAIASSVLSLAGVLFFGWDAAKIVFLVILEVLIVLAGDFIKAVTVPVRTASGGMTRGAALTMAIFYVPWVAVGANCLLFAAFGSLLGGAFATTAASPGFWSAVASVAILQATKLASEMQRALRQPSVPAYLNAGAYSLWLLCAAGLLLWMSKSTVPKNLHDMAIATALALFGVRLVALLIGALAIKKMAEEGTRPGTREHRAFVEASKAFRQQLVMKREFT